MRHHRDTLVFLSPETRDVAVRDSGDKGVQSMELDIVYLFTLALSLASLRGRKGVSRET